MPENNLDISRRVQEKFEFYFLSLTFIVLGLCIQTSEFGDSVLTDSLELISWVCLFIAGLSGLSRMHWVPLAYKVAHAFVTRKGQLKEAKSRQNDGELHVVISEGNKMPIGEFIEKAEPGVKAVENQLAKLKKNSVVKYRLHVWGFAAGLFFLICSRGLDPALRIARWVITSLKA